MSKKLALVRWLVDETVSIVPLSVAVGKQPSELHPRLVTSMRYSRGKIYEAQILKISSNRKQLNKLCQDLENFDISMEEILGDTPPESEQVVTSSDDATPKKKPTANKKKQTTKEKPRPRKPKPKTKPSDTANEIFADIEAASKKAKRMFSSSDASTHSCPKKPKYSFESSDLSEIEDEQPEEQTTPIQGHYTSELSKAMEEIERLKRQLRSKQGSPPVSVTKNFVTNSSFDSLQKNVHMEESPGPGVLAGSSHHDFEEEDNLFDDYDGHRFHTPESSRKKSAGQASRDFLQTTPARKLHENNHGLYERKVKPALVELVKGYGVMLTQRQLDEAIYSGGNSPTKLIRNLLSVFFTKQTLAASSAYGGRINKALDRDILAACLSFVQSKFPVSKTTLVDAVNDKCAQARRPSPSLGRK